MNFPQSSGNTTVNVQKLNDADYIIMQSQAAGTIGGAAWYLEQDVQILWTLAYVTPDHAGDQVTIGLTVYDTATNTNFPIFYFPAIYTAGLTVMEKHKFDEMFISSGHILNCSLANTTNAGGAAIILYGVRFAQKTENKIIIYETAPNTPCGIIDFLGGKCHGG